MYCHHLRVEDGVKTGVPELKHRNDDGNNTLTLRRPACPATGGQSWHVSRWLRGYSGARSVPWHREDGQSVLCISFQGTVHLRLTHCLVAQDGGQEGPASVIQFYEYEKADHAFKTGSRSPSSTKMVEVVIRQGQRLSSVF